MLDLQLLHSNEKPIKLTEQTHTISVEIKNEHSIRLSFNFVLILLFARYVFYKKTRTAHFFFFCL